MAGPDLPTQAVPAGGPGRPRRRLDPAVRRQQILQAAATVFARSGFERAHMAEVAVEAGVAKGLLYRHFATKEELYAAVLAERAAGFEGRVERRLIEEVPAAAARGVHDPVAFGITTWLDQVADDLAAGRLPDPGTHDLLDAFRQRIRDVAARHLQLVRPDLGATRARLVAAAVLGATEAAGRAWLADPATVDVGGLRRLLEDLLLPGLLSMGAAEPPA